MLKMIVDLVFIVVSVLPFPLAMTVLTGVLVVVWSTLLLCMLIPHGSQRLLLVLEALCRLSRAGSSLPPLVLVDKERKEQDR